MVPPPSPEEECKDMEADTPPMEDDQDPSNETVLEQPPLPAEEQIQPPVASPDVEPVPPPVPAPVPDEVPPPKQVEVKETLKVVQIPHSEVKILQRVVKPQEVKPTPLELDHKSIQTDVIAIPKSIPTKPPAQPRGKATVQQDCKALQTDPPVVKILTRKHLAEDKQVTAHIKPEMRQVTAILKPEERQVTTILKPETKAPTNMKPEPKPEVKPVAPPKYKEAKPTHLEPKKDVSIGTPPSKASSNPSKSVRSGTIRVEPL